MNAIMFSSALKQSVWMYIKNRTAKQKRSKRSPYQMLYRASKRETMPYNPHFLSAGFGRILKKNNPVAFFLSRFKTLLCLGAVLYGSARKIHHCTSRSLLRKYSQSCLRPYYLGTAKRIRFGYSESFFRLLILLFRVNFNSVFAYL